MSGARDGDGDEGRHGDVASRWNARYASADDAVPPPADVLSRNERWLPPLGAPGGGSPDVGGPGEATRTGERPNEEGSGTADRSGSSRAGPTALDLACGRAGNGEWLAARGFRVTAWDVSRTVVEAIRARSASGIFRAEARDVVVRPPAPDTFDVIVVARFLERALCPAIAAALRPGGTLFYQTFTHGLASPDFLLGPNELLALFPTLAICRYREPAPGADGRAEATLVARRTR